MGAALCLHRALLSTDLCRLENPHDFRCAAPRPDVTAAIVSVVVDDGGAVWQLVTFHAWKITFALGTKSPNDALRARNDVLHRQSGIEVAEPTGTTQDVHCMVRIR